MNNSNGHSSILNNWRMTNDESKIVFKVYFEPLIFCLCVGFVMNFQHQLHTSTSVSITTLKSKWYFQLLEKDSMGAFIVASGILLFWVEFQEKLGFIPHLPSLLRFFFSLWTIGFVFLIFYIVSRNLYLLYVLYQVYHDSSSTEGEEDEEEQRRKKYCKKRSCGSISIEITFRIIIIITPFIYFFKAMHECNIDPTEFLPFMLFASIILLGLLIHLNTRKPPSKIVALLAHVAGFFVLVMIFQLANAVGLDLLSFYALACSCYMTLFAIGGVWLHSGLFWGTYRRLRDTSTRNSKPQVVDRQVDKKEMMIFQVI